MVATTSLSLVGYKLTFDDEFNLFSSNGPSHPYTTTHTGTWDTTLSYGERKLNDEVETYSDPTIGVNPDSVSNGVLDIQAAPATNLSQSYGQAYTSGIITTNHSFAQEYGYFEMRAELPQGAGMWPAFWLLPLQHVWPPELDPLEAFGRTTTNNDGGAYSMHYGLVTTDPNAPGGWVGTAGANLYNQYNTFGVDWEPDSITYYLNGVAYAKVATPSDFHQPMYMLANLAVGGNWAGAPVGETGDLKIDYIRAFSNNAANPAIDQQQISSPDGRGYNFFGATDASGNGALGGTDLPALPSTQPVTIGSGNDTLALAMAEDASQGDAQFTISIDGVQIGGTQTVTASHGLGQTQLFSVMGSFGPGRHMAAIDFLNPGDGTAGIAQRSLYVTGAVMDGTIVPSTSGDVPGTQEFSFDGATSAAVTLGSGSDTLALSVSDEPWQGDAQFAIVVDGNQIGGIQTAIAVLAAGASQTFDVLGDFTPGQHTVSVIYLNDAWGGSADTDRNLYVNAMSFDGAAIPGSALTLLRGGTQSVSFAVPGSSPTLVTPTPLPILVPTPAQLPVVTLGAGSYTLAIAIAEDAWQGDAQFTLAVDGAQIGGVQTATAAQAVGASQTYDILGDLIPGTHTVLVTFMNDAWGGSGSTDRNLYVDGITLDGTAIANSSLVLLNNGSQGVSFAVPPPSSPNVTPVPTVTSEPIVTPSPTVTPSPNLTTGSTAASTTANGPVPTDGVVFLDANATLTCAGAETVIGGAGSATVIAATGSPEVFAFVGALDFVGGTGTSTVVAGAISMTLTGGTGTMLAFSDGRTFYTGGGGADTLVGMAGSLSVQAGMGGGLFFGGTAGGNVITAGTGAVTAFGGGKGDVMTASGSANVVFAGGVGTETLTGAGSTGSNTFFAGTGNQTLVGGSGNTVLVAGAGNQVLAGGDGLTLFSFAREPTTGTDTITGFDPSHDFVKLTGYPADTASVLSAAVLVNGSTILTLPDGTRVTFAGVMHFDPTSFI